MQLKRSLELNVSKTTVWQEFKGNNLFRYRKRDRAPMVKNQHKTHDLQWSIEKAHWKTTCHKVFFDEKSIWMVSKIDSIIGTI